MRTKLLCFSSLLITAAAGPPSSITLSGDNIIPVTINGEAVRIKVDPAYAGAVTVNPDIVSRAKLKRSMLGFRHRVGPVTISFWSDSAKADYGLGIEKRRIFWPDRSIITGSDGLAGPNALPWSRLTFTIGPKAEGEQEIDLPLETTGTSGLSGTITKLQLGDAEVKVWFSLILPQSLATAGLGAELARSNGGAKTGVAHLVPIRFGIERPVRTMRLAVPLAIGGRPLAEMGVRTADFGDASGIPEAGAVTDPDEIVVTAAKKGRPDYSLLVGRDFLSCCSSLTYDFPAKLIRLSCLSR